MAFDTPDFAFLHLLLDLLPRVPPPHFRDIGNLGSSNVIKLQQNWIGLSATAWMLNEIFENFDLDLDSAPDVALSDFSSALRTPFVKIVG